MVGRLEGPKMQWRDKAMCGRYDLNITAMEIAARFRLLQQSKSGNSDKAGETIANLAEWQPRYNIAPGQDNPVIVRGAGGHNQLEFMRWGLVPAWSKEPRVSYSTINARAETVAAKPTFRKALATQRCLVPATGYFEWARVGNGKQPYRIGLPGEGDGVDGLDGIFAFAGLYDIWHGPDGEELQTYTIVTAEANDAVRDLHPRMPVILQRDVEGEWLDQEYRDIEQLLALLKPYPGEGMTAYPVSRLVNSALHEGRGLIEPMQLLAA